MKKLTQSEAKELVKQAYIYTHHLGIQRFGQALSNLIPCGLLFDPIVIREAESDFYYEQNPDIVMEKFYKFYVEELNDQQ